MLIRSITIATVTCSTFLASVLEAADWPMWRFDAQRSAVTPEKLPDELQLRWVRHLPTLKPAYRESRLQFDAGYEPVVAGKWMFIGSSRDGSVMSLETETGRKRWTFYTNGSIRFAPVVQQGKVYFGSDDGHLYCLSANDGRQLWKFRAAPSMRRVLGNGRLISLWPLRGGPVVHNDRIYFAAGVWSFEGVFIYCLDSASGAMIWRNDDSGFVYGQHPHGAEAFGGVTPQGYLVVSGDDLVVPCGQAYPARFDLLTGKLKAFELPKPGRLPGGWFASAAERRGEVKFDSAVNRDLHEDKVYQGRGTSGVRDKITVGGNELTLDESAAHVNGEVHSVLAADGKLFVVSKKGGVYCFANGPVETTQHVWKTTALPAPQELNAGLRDISQAAAGDHGYAVVLGAKSFEWLAQLLAHTHLRLLVVDADHEKIDSLRRQFGQTALYGERIELFVDDPKAFSLPPYLASLLLAEDASQLSSGHFDVLRPYGGRAMLQLTEQEHDRLVAELRTSEDLDVLRNAPWTTVQRVGALKGAVNYTGNWASPDERVRMPLGVLWFDDTLGHFKRSPQPWFVDGVMISYPKDWMEKHRQGKSSPYRLLPPVYSDVYTGRLLNNEETRVSSLKYPSRDLEEEQPNQYRPPTQLDAWKPKQPIIGERVNPLTGKKEPRAIAKSYGCDGGVDYGYIFTMRSGTPAFYDKRMESGVCSISGPRSGCTNSIIPACGVLNVPYFYEGCTCSYPLPIGLALIKKPEEHEQWSSWGPGKVDNIRRVGINFGAPGDRMTESGTLWLDSPNRGGPSPSVSVQVEPETAEYFYRHSLWMQGGQGWGWVAASGVQGAKTITLEGFEPAAYTVRLYFAEPEFRTNGKRTFDVSINGTIVKKGLDVAQATGGRMRSLVRQFDGIQVEGRLRIDLDSRNGRTILSGIEVLPPAPASIP